MPDVEINQQQAAQYQLKMNKFKKRQARRQKWGRHFDSSRIILAIILIATGVICLLNNLGITNISFVYAFNLIWPSLLILAGVLLVINFRSVLMMICGLFLMVAGALFLVNNSGFWPVDFKFAWGILWPLIVIFIGANFLFHEREELAAPAPPASVAPVIQAPPCFPDKVDNNKEAAVQDIEIAAGPAPAEEGSPEAPASASADEPITEVPNLDKEV